MESNIFLLFDKLKCRYQMVQIRKNRGSLVPYVIPSRKQFHGWEGVRRDLMGGNGGPLRGCPALPPGAS